MPDLQPSHRRTVALLVGLGLTCSCIGSCSGAVTVESTSTAPRPSGTAPGPTATVPMPSATLAGGSATPVQPPLSGKGVPGTDVAKAVREAVGAEPSVTMTLTTQAGKATAAIDMARKAVDLAVGDPAAPVRLVHAGGATYVRGAGTVTVRTTPTAVPTPSGSTTAMPPPEGRATTRPWLQLRADGSDVLSRRLGAARDVESMLRPAAFVDMFEGLTGDETPLGTGRRVSFWVPAEAYVATVRGGPTLAAALTKPVVVVLELDEENRPTKLTATMTSGKATIVDETQYAKWGEPVSVRVPPADETGPAPLPGAPTDGPADPATDDRPTSTPRGTSTTGSAAPGTSTATGTPAEGPATTTVTVTATPR